MDHAGLGEELKQRGVPLLVIDLQVEAIPIMKTWMKPSDNYVEITQDGNVTISCNDSRDLLAEISIAGQIIHTPGHSDDSVSLLLDDGSVFTGDLPAEVFCWDNPKALASWQLLREMGAQHVYPAHGPTRPLDPDAHGSLKSRLD
jgi:glyoxylase-like metal-dependent hydrolase (beta-lactamase superfamily II)